VQARNLNRRLADPAPSRQDQHHIAGPDARQRQHVPRRQEGEWKGRRLDKADVIRNRDQIADRHGDELGVAAIRHVTNYVIAGALVITAVQARRTDAAAQARLQHHARAGRRPLPALDLPHFAGHVGSRDVWQRDPHALDPSPLPEIEMIQGAGAHAHDGVPRARLRIRRVFINENVGRSVLMEPGGFHN
jgi:hypothetical protein